jgi:hypothetical protein
MLVFVLIVGAGLVSPKPTLLPGSSSSPSPSLASPLSEGTIVQILSVEELERLVDADLLEPGRVVIADVEIAALMPACSLGTPCKTVYVIRSEGRKALASLAIANGLEYIRTSDGAVASEATVVLRMGGIESARGMNVVDILGRPVFASHVGQTWTVDGLLGSEGLEDFESLYPVEGWLSGWMTSPSCPPSMDPDGTIRDQGPYGCGSAAWLSPDRTRPVSWSSGPPAGSIRVQNGAFLTYATAPADGTAREPRPLQRAVYLIRMDVLDGRPCFFCAGVTVAQIVARLDPLPIPDSRASNQPPSPAVGAVSIRTIFEDPTWAGDPVSTEDVVLCRGASDCGSTASFYPGISIPIEDVDFSAETMLRVVRGTPTSVSWDGTVLEIKVTGHDTGFWEGAIGIDLGDVPEYTLRVTYVVCLRVDGHCP